jgi:2-amino-4-hydroxy-6-hydroxymethyldihydropteridine diphosphokinase
MKQRVFVGLGSNVGDRLAFLRAAVQHLSSLPDTEVVGASSVYETEPVGKKDQSDFLNAVVELRSGLELLTIHKACKLIETKVGRTIRERWGPREIDIDLLYVGDLRFESPELTVPHPEIVHRRFVLVGLSEIAGRFVDPIRKMTMAQLLASCRDQSLIAKTAFSIQPAAHPPGALGEMIAGSTT